METHPVDIDPGQIVRWIKAECEAAPATFKIDARRNTEVREGPAAKRRLTRLLNAIETNRPHSTRG